MISIKRKPIIMFLIFITCIKTLPQLPLNLSHTHARGDHNSVQGWELTGDASPGSLSKSRKYQDFLPVNDALLGDAVPVAVVTAGVPGFARAKTE